MSKKISELPIIASLEEGDQLTALDVSALPAEQNVRITKANLQAGLAKTGDDAADFGSGAATNGQVLTADGAGNSGWENPAGGSGHIIADEGVQLPAQSILNFVGAGVTVTDGTGETVVTITGGGGGGVDNPLTEDLDVGTFDIISTAGNNVGFASGVADGASAVGFEFDTANNLTTSGAKLLSLMNFGVEKAYIDKDGVLFLDSGASNGTFKVTTASNSARFDLYNLTVKNQSGANGTNIFDGAIRQLNYWGFEKDRVEYNWNSTVAPTIRIAQKANDLNATLALTVAAQNAFVNAATNLIGGALNLQGGAGATNAAGAAHGGSVKINGGTGYGTGAVGNIIMDTLPTSNPNVAGALWNNAGVLNISAG